MNPGAVSLFALALTVTATEGFARQHQRAYETAWLAWAAVQLGLLVWWAL